MGAAQLGGIVLGHAEMPDLALLNEIRDRTDRVFERNARVDARWFVQVDHIDAQPLQRIGAEVLDGVGTRVEPKESAGTGSQRPEFDRQIGLVAATFEGLAHQRLVQAHRIEVSGVE